jgi:hypothetical protein
MTMDKDELVSATYPYMTVCAHCGTEIAVPGSWMVTVSHNPNDGKYYHNHCWRASLRARSPEGGTDV